MYIIYLRDQVQVLLYLHYAEYKISFHNYADDFQMLSSFNPVKLLPSSVAVLTSLSISG